MNSHYTFASKPNSSRTGCLPASDKQIRSASVLPSSNQVLQRKVRVGSANDPMEAEADRAADAVLSDNEASISSFSAAAPAQRKCTQCGEEDTQTIRRQPEEEEEELQAKPAEGGLIQREEEEEEMLQAKAASGETCSTCASKAGDSAASAVSSGGRPLSESDRSYFEPRFGRDFSDVRVHTHSNAESAAGSINAKAFTLGNNIAFGSGQFSPNSAPGRQLLAHELAHVVQQKGGSQNTVRRAVSKHSKCKANKHGAPAKPLDKLDKLNQRAVAMSLLADIGLSLITLEPTLFLAEQKAFKQRFGEPPVSGKQFKNRFSGKKYKTKNEAFLGEIDSAAGQFRKITKQLGKSIVYRCPGKKSIAIEDCASSKCSATDVALSCAGSKMSDLIVCPNFWTMTDDQLGGVLIHEVVHARLNRSGHPQDVKKRHRNPECFTSFVADTQGFTPFDPKCPKIP